MWYIEQVNYLCDLTNTNINTLNNDPKLDMVPQKYGNNQILQSSINNKI